MWKNRLCVVRCSKIPVTRKCCFCVPVRQGVIIFGYINLTVSLLAFPLLIFLLVEQLSLPEVGSPEQPPAPAAGQPPAPAGQPPGTEPARLPLTVLWVTVDVLMNTALVVAAHKRNQTLLKVYLYFGLAFQALTLFIDLVLFEYGDHLENIVYSLFLGLNLYLLYLVYSTIHALRESSEVQYVSHQDP